MQALRIDLVVAYAGQHGHAIARQGRAVYPARGLAQARAHFRRLALQQENLPHGRRRHGRHQATAGGRIQVHAPLARPGRHGLRQRVRRVVQQILPHVEADAARADDGHARADGFLGLQHIQIRQHFRMLDAGNGRQAHLDAGGDDDVVIAAGQQLLARHALAQAQLDFQQRQPAGKVADGFRKFFLARYLHGHLELAAHAVAAVEQGHCVPAFGGHAGGRQAGRPGADDGHPARHGLFRVHEFGFMAGARVDQAAGALVGKGVVETRLVAADAGVDFVGAA